MAHKKLEPKVRKEQILEAAVKAAMNVGYYAFRREHVAGLAKVSTGTVNNYYGTMAQLRRAVMRRAVRDEIHEIIASGLANYDAVARKAPEELRHAAVASML